MVVDEASLRQVAAVVVTSVQGVGLVRTCDVIAGLCPVDLVLCVGGSAAATWELDLAVVVAFHWMAVLVCEESIVVQMLILI